LSVRDRGRAQPDRLLPVPPRGRLGAGGAPEHGRLALDPPPPRGGGRRRSPPLPRSSVAREPVRGLPDRAPDRAGADRAYRARLGAVSRLAALAALLRLEGLLGEPGRVLPRHRGDEPALTRRQAAPDVPRCQRDAQGAEAFCDTSPR